MNLLHKDLSLFTHENITEDNNDNNSHDLTSRSNSNFKSNFNDEQITFINYTHQYCVCIIDIVDSTTKTQMIASSEKIRQYYSIFLNTMASIIKYNNGKVIKNAGDCLIYYFPKTVDTVTNKSSIQDVLDCGLAMIEANSVLNANLNKNGLPSIDYRISGNYGKVELATSSNSNSVDLFGPTVNICSKINHLALSNEMVIYKDLYDVVKNTPFFKEYRFKELSTSKINLYDKDKDDNNNDLSALAYPVYSVHRTRNQMQQMEIEDKKRQNHVEQKQIKQNQDNSTFNILLIDDDRDILFTFTSIIEGEGYKTISFSDPQKALNHFSQMSPYHYDLIVMDIRMPGINGIQLYSKLKVMNPDIKVLFLSALDAVEELLSIFSDIKSSEIIRKPIEPQELIAKVNRILKTY
jgi:two-component system, OmpR family, response regulator ChvI